MRVNEIIENDYRGEHTAPAKEGANTLDNLADIYGDDIYSIDAVRMFGAHESYDGAAIDVIRAARGKPNSTVKVYRAVPIVQNPEERMREIEADMAAYQRRGNVPTKHKRSDGNQWYEDMSVELERLGDAQDEAKVRYKIKPDDWVSLTKEYAIDHGKDNLGKFRIVSKTVRAKDLATDGNSIHEWGWVP